MSVSRSGVPLLAAALVGCGGGGGVESNSWLFPVWVPTDVAVADVDGDGRLDLVLLGGDDQPLLMLQSAQQPAAFLAPRALP